MYCRSLALGKCSALQKLDAGEDMGATGAHQEEDCNRKGSPFLLHLLLTTHNIMPVGKGRIFKESVLIFAEQAVKDKLALRGNRLIIHTMFVCTLT